MWRECFDEQTTSITILATTTMQKSAVRPSCLPRILASGSTGARDNTALGNSTGCHKILQDG
jgi:hypothetical protein